MCWMAASHSAADVLAPAPLVLLADVVAAAVLALIGTLIAFAIWPREDAEVVAHTHDDLPPDHPHLLEGHPGGRARHAFVIDELHPRWPIT